MESLPFYTTCPNLDQSVQSKTGGLGSVANDPKAANNKHSTAESVLHTTDRNNHCFCLRCLQVKHQVNISVVDSGNGSEAESFKPLNCRTVGYYLENNKDDNYFEEFMLPEKVLSKFALVLGKCASV